MKKIKVEEVTIEGVVYVPKDSIIEPVKNTEGMPYVMIRTYSAGVHCGFLKSQSDDGRVSVLIDSIRIWKWSGAASLSQLAMEGSNDGSNCKFSMPVLENKLSETIETIIMTDKAIKNIKSIESWKQ